MISAFLGAFARAFLDALRGDITDPEPPAEPPVVRIAYQELYEAEVPDNGPERRYAYHWPFATPPVVGQRVVVTSRLNPIPFT